MFNPSSDSGGRIHQLESSQPDNRDYDRVECHCLSYPAHYRERSAESSGSSHATPASPSGRTGSSSCGSRRVLECSSAHWEPCRPSPVPGMTPAAGPAQRIGDSTSLSRLYLSTFPVSIDAGESRFGPAIFTDSPSERSRWIENPNFASSWRVTAPPGSYPKTGVVIMV